MEWWGYSKEHGWVVLDRSISSNAPGLKDSLLFFRCRDSTTFVEKRKNWNPPLYRFAPNYLRDLGPELSAAAEAELDGLKALWPESQLKVKREIQEAEERERALQAEEAVKAKAEAKEKKKLAAAVE
jgi:hypothetical protein